MAGKPIEKVGGGVLAEIVETTVASITPNVSTVINFDALKAGYTPIMAVLRAVGIGRYYPIYPGAIVSNNSFTCAIISTESTTQTNVKAWAVVLYQKN